MKSKFFLLAALVTGLLTIAFPSPSYGQLTKKMEKQLEKERGKMYKEKIKTLKQENWKIAGSSKTLEVALLEHYDKLAGDGVVEWTGEVSRCRSINAGRHAAIANAQTTYASEMCAEIEGYVGSIVTLDQSIPESEVDLFTSEFGKNVKANLSGIMKESYALVKDHGSYKEYRIVFIIDQTQAGLLQKRALEATMENSQLSQDILNKIRKDVENAKAK